MNPKEKEIKNEVYIGGYFIEYGLSKFMKLIEIKYANKE